jgi:queuine tRNA-ribosyltransferase
MSPLNFDIESRIEGALGRAGTLRTSHGDIETPAFVTVGTKATVNALAPEQVRALGAQVVLANTYHLYLQPGDEVVRDMGGLHQMMHWDGPMMTDSGGFQAFSLGAAFGEHVSKIAKGEDSRKEKGDKGSQENPQLAKITEDGVSFRSHIDGSEHMFTPEKSMQIQHNLGADMIFAFDECTSPTDSYEYQREAMDRTHRWAKRSIDAHKANKKAAAKQGLLGIVQGGRHEDLRKESARVIGDMDFDGFGIGGSFTKEDMNTAIKWVNEILPEEKPRHLLGIGEPYDLFGAVEHGCDIFDCVAPTRIARNGTLHTADGRINILNARFVSDHTPIDNECSCYTCQNYTRSYVSHLFRAKEMYAATLASIHNLHFIISLVDGMREAIHAGTFYEYRDAALKRYYKDNDAI